MKILLAVNDPGLRHSLRPWLIGDRHQVYEVTSSKEVLNQLEIEDFGACIIGMCMSQNSRQRDGMVAAVDIASKDNPPKVALVDRTEPDNDTRTQLNLYRIRFIVEDDRLIPELKAFLGE